MNALNSWLIYDQIVDDGGYGFYTENDPADKTQLNFTHEITMTDDHELPALIDRLNLILAHGALSQRSKALILKVLKDFVLEDQAEDIERLRLLRVKMAVILIMSSPEYLINR